MSSEALGWAFRRSPYRGARFAVHLAIADIVNDQHGNRFWLKQEDLAAKARVGRQTVNEALATMCQDGTLKLLREGGGRSRPSEFLFLMPNLPDRYETVAIDDSNGTALQKTVVSGDSKQGETVVSGDRQRTQEVQDLELKKSCMHEDVHARHEMEEQHPAIAALCERLHFADLVDASYWTKIRDLTEGTTVYYDDELRRYAAWLESRPPARRHRNHKRGFLTWIQTEIGRDARRGDARKQRT